MGEFPRSYHTERAVTDIYDGLVAKYGGRHTVTMMPGEGIGPEMMEYVKDIYKAAGVPVDFEMVFLDPTTDNYDDLYNAISSVTKWLWNQG